MEEGSGTIPRAGEVRFCAEDASGNCNVCKGFGHRSAEMLRSLNWYAKNFANFRFDVCARARPLRPVCMGESGLRAVDRSGFALSPSNSLCFLERNALVQFWLVVCVCVFFWVQCLSTFVVVLLL